MSGSFAGEVLNCLPDHIAVLDLAGNISALNDTWKESVEQDSASAKLFNIGANYVAIWEELMKLAEHKGSIDAAFEGVRSIIINQQSNFSCEYSCGPVNDKRWFLIRLNRFSDVESSRIIVAHENITTRKRDEAALRDTEQTLRRVLEALPVGVWILNDKGQIVHGNAACQQIWANSQDNDAIQFSEYKGWRSNTGKSIGVHEWAVMRALHKGETSRDEEIEIQCFDGSHKIILNSAAPLYDSEHRIFGAVSVNQDITPRKRAEEALLHAKEVIEVTNYELEQALAREQLLARADSLTGAKTRRHFFDLASHEFAVAKRYLHPLAVVLFDLDHFKNINDTYGHQVGDEVLAKVAQITSRHLRQSDIFARYGGEEFIILFPKSDASEALVVAERIREDIAANSGGEDRKAGVTISIGIAALLEQEDALDRLIHRADQALYSAKEEGRNRSKIYIPVYKPAFDI